MKLVEKLNIKKNLHFKLEDIYFCILIILIFITDRFFKIKIITKFSDNTFFVNNFINLDLIWNTGIGFGILTSDSIIVYNLITIFIALVILYLIYIAINSDRFDKFVFSIIIGGALGNFYDRLFFKAVPDFIDFHFKDYTGLHLILQIYLSLSV